MMIGTTKRRHAAVRMAFAIVVTSLRASDAQVTTEDVDRAIKHGSETILNSIRLFDTITWDSAAAGRPRQSATGRVERNRGGVIHLRKTDGETIRIPQDRVRSWEKRGFVQNEMTSMHHGGPTALAALALLAANVDLSDERMDLIIDALVEHPLPEAGTYVRSIRASVWSELLSARRITKEQRRTFKRLLHADVQWLIREMRPSGAFDYGFDISVSGGDGDSSNTQFANLGLWRGDLHGGEVGRKAWQRVEDYWMGLQDPGGGWPYVRASGPTSSMTVAGCNSLYIVLERLYARSDRPYQLFTGCRPVKKTRDRVAEIFQAIRDGDSFLRLHPPDVVHHQRYELFGIERLGLASGRAEIGGRDWFKHYAATAVGHRWGRDTVSDAFTLIFLVHGQAPILFQKLAHGDDESDWNYYFRDLHGLTQYLSRSFEQLYRWQYVPPNADLHTLENAPILLISGHAGLELSAAMQDRLHEYVVRGGTIMLHADRRSRKFAKDARAVFEQMFQSRRWTFQKLPADHALYTCLHALNERRLKFPLEAITDGPRVAVLLSPVDLAGAWHQQRENFADVFKLMANLRVYSAPENETLPRVLRPVESAVTRHNTRGAVKIRRFVYEGDWAGHLGIWQRRAAHIERASGIAVEAEEVEKPADAKALCAFDLVHVSVRGNNKLKSADVARLDQYAQSGGLVLIESTDGQSEGNAAVLRLVDQMTVGTRRHLMPDDPLAAGTFENGAPLTELVTTRTGSALMRPGSAPPILLREAEGRVAVIACPFDLSSGLERHHVWRRVGFDGPSTDRIVQNILNLRLADQRKAAKRADD